MPDKVWQRTSKWFQLTAEINGELIIGIHFSSGVRDKMLAEMKTACIEQRKYRRNQSEVDIKEFQCGNFRQ